LWRGKELEIEGVEDVGKAVEGAGRVVGEATDGVVERSILGVVGAEGLEQPRNDLDYEKIKHGHEKRHPDAKSDVMRQAGDDLLPITKAQDAGEEEVPCAVQQVEAAEQPEEVAEVDA
jgi:hypothetical protein